jgi:hypothetical protein
MLDPGAAIAHNMPVARSCALFELQVERWRSLDRGRGDPRFGRGERHADRAVQRHAPEPHRPARADAVEFLEGVQDGLPLGNSLRRQKAL